MAERNGRNLGQVTVEGQRVELSEHAPTLIRNLRDRQLSVRALLEICQSYDGPASHFLLSDYINDNDAINIVFKALVQNAFPDILVDLLKALLAKCPQLMTLTTERSGDSLLHLALTGPGGCHHLQRLLAVPQTTRLVNQMGKTPLHVACESLCVHPSVIHHLIDLDPDVLTVPDGTGRVPLHAILSQDPSSTVVPRMIDLKPDTLFSRDDLGRTPLMAALDSARGQRAVASLEGVDALRQFSQQHPRTLSITDAALPPDAGSPLTSAMNVAGSSAGRGRLVRAVVDAHPVWLVMSGGRRRPGDLDGVRSIPGLPFEAIAFSYVRNQRSCVQHIQDETVSMALAVVEYVLGVSAANSAVAEGADATAAENVAWFQRHVKGTLQRRFPTVPVEGEPGLSVAQSLLVRSGDDTSRNLLALVRALFSHDRVVELLRGESRLLRDVVLCETVVDLYRMNRRGRRRPHGQQQPHFPVGAPYESSVEAAMHQVDLLASLKDSGTLESTYLQFREESHRSLLVHGRQRGGARVGGSSRAGPRSAPEPREARKRKSGSSGIGTVTGSAQRRCARPSSSGKTQDA